MHGPGVLGKYRLLAELGRGGMADVYLAVAEDGLIGFNKLHVIKCLRRHGAEDPELLSMFLDEARLAARLRHSNVVQAFEIGQEGDDYYLVLEYLDGQSLHRILGRAGRGRPLPLPLHLGVLAEVLAGLHYAHELCDFDGTPLGVVHRDVSPHNVFVTYEGRGKLVDFGIAKATTATVETRTGVVKGKVTYMAPEQARGRPVDRRADVFAVGVMLWEALAGRRLWAGKAEHQVLLELTSGRLPAAPEALAKADERLRRACARALAPDPADRYPTAEAMRCDLDEYLSATGGHASGAALGRFVAELFADRRAELHALIETQLRAAVGSAPPPLEQLLGATSSRPAFPGGATASGVRGTASGTRSSPSGVSSAPGLPSLRNYVPDEPTAATAPSAGITGTGSGARSSGTSSWTGGGAAAGAGRGRLGLAAGLALAACAAGGAFVALTRARPGPHAAATAAASPAPALAEVRLRATPPGASLYYDDVPLAANPYVANFARDGTAHRVRVEAEGFRTQHRMLTLDRPVVELAVALEPDDRAKGERPKAEADSSRDAGSSASRRPGRKPPAPAAPPPVDDPFAKPGGARRPPAAVLPAEDPWENPKR